MNDPARVKPQRALADVSASPISTDAADAPWRGPTGAKSAETFGKPHRGARPAAVDDAPRRSVSSSARGPLALGLAGLVLLIGGFGFWSVNARIAGAVVAPGQVQVDQQSQIVQHPEGGVVDAIAVRDGQAVAAGDLLIRLDDTRLRTELAIVEGQYSEILARRGRLEAERAERLAIAFPPELTGLAALRPEIGALMEGQASLFAHRRDTQQRRVAQLLQQARQVREQIAGIDAQAAALHTQRSLIGQELADQRSLLDRGLAQASRVLALEREAARLDGQLGEMRATRAQNEARVTEIDMARLGEAAARREAAEAELRELGYRALELGERRGLLTRQIALMDIRAPASGIVHQLQVTTPRAVIRPADTLLFIVPQDRPMVVSARISPIDIDELSIGQDVVLRFSAFSGRITPEIRGRLEHLSADAVTDEVTQAQFYRAEITIPRNQRDDPGQPALIPGMPVEAYIQTRTRSPLSYLTRPLTDYLGRAFREE